MNRRAWLGSASAGLVASVPGLGRPSVAQDAQMLRHRRLRHTQLLLDVPHGLLGYGQQAQDGPAIWLTEDSEGGFHTKYIPI